MKNEVKHPTRMDKKILKLAKNAAKKLCLSNITYNFDYSYDIEDDFMTIYVNEIPVLDFFSDTYLTDFGEEIDVSRKTDEQIEKIIIKRMLRNYNDSRMR